MSLSAHQGTTKVAMTGPRESTAVTNSHTITRSAALVTTDGERVTDGGVIIGPEREHVLSGTAENSVPSGCTEPEQDC
jgi:hypothetical protein